MDRWITQLYILTALFAIIAFLTFQCEVRIEERPVQASHVGTYSKPSSGVIRREPTAEQIQKVILKIKNEDQQMMLQGIPIGDPNLLQPLSLIHDAQLGVGT